MQIAPNLANIFLHPYHHLQAAVASGAATPNTETEENTPYHSDREENGHAAEDTGDRSCTGILTSHPQSRDIQFEKFTLLFHGHMLLEDTNLELNYGRSVLSAMCRVIISDALMSAHSTLCCREVWRWLMSVCDGERGEGK